LLENKKIINLLKNTKKRELLMTNVEKYKEFCRQEEKICLFSQDWWLDAVCDKGKWDVALVEKNGEIVASMPYYIKKRAIFTTITQPILTKRMGPYIKYPQEMKHSSILSWDKKIMAELIEQLPKVDTFKQSFDYSITNLLPFYWKGYSLSIRYSYNIDNLSNTDELFRRFSSSTKREIRNAIKNKIEIIDSNDVDKFYEINKITYQRQNIPIPYSLKLIKKIYREAEKRNAVVMKFAVKDDIVYSVRLLFYDNKSLYGIAGSSNRNIKLYGSEHLLDWETIKLASKKGLSFDFNGSMLEGVESRIRSFGTTQKSYPLITKTNSTFLKIISAL
jgi:lipid II:glycine glycyltransferase (peptidoglycan interpeptide bridge formation enzyme)